MADLTERAIWHWREVEDIRRTLEEAESGTLASELWSSTGSALVVAIHELGATIALAAEEIRKVLASEQDRGGRAARVESRLRTIAFLEGLEAVSHSAARRELIDRLVALESAEAARALRREDKS